MKYMVEQAVINVNILVEKYNMAEDKAITKVSNKMELSEEEIDEVKNALKEDTKKSKENPYPASIYFTVPDEIDDVAGVLMYNNIPWESKGSDEDKNYIQFAGDENLSKAMSSLNRKYEIGRASCRERV